MLLQKMINKNKFSEQKTRQEFRATKYYFCIKIQQNLQKTLNSKPLKPKIIYQFICKVNAKDFNIQFGDSRIRLEKKYIIKTFTKH